MICDKIYETIGNTPVVKVHGFDEENRAELYAKLEYFNPGGSVKDRIAYYIIRTMEEEGRLKKSDTLVEATSGNTGIGLSLVARSLGYKVVIVMPETMSEERKRLMKAYGAELILTDGKKGMAGAVAHAELLVKEKGYVAVRQFENQLNPKAHRETTALEIIKDFDDLDVFVAGIGTGGTISGTGEVLKDHYKNLKIIGVEPDSSAVLSGEKSGPHKIQGIGAGFVPKTLNEKIYDELVRVKNEDAYKYTVEIARTNGLLLGISSGAAFYAALEEAKKLGREKKVLFIAPDNGERYLSTGLYD